MDASCNDVIRIQKGEGMEQIVSKDKPAVTVHITWDEVYQ